MPNQVGPGARLWPSLVMDAEDDVLYLYGGRSAEGFRNDLWAFDLAARSWTLVEPDCQPGAACPPPGMGSALLSTTVPGVVTMALGSPDEGAVGAALEWRYLLGEHRWVTEEEARGRWRRPAPGPGWCASAPPGDGPAERGAPLALAAALLVLVALRRRPR